MARVGLFNIMPPMKIRGPTHELTCTVGTIAPRPCFISAPTGDTNFRWRSVDRIVEAARPVYTLLGERDALEVAHPDSDHDFPAAMRERAYALLDRHLPARA